MKISTSLDHAIRIGNVSLRESAAMLKKAGFEGVDLPMCHDQDVPEKMLRPEWAQPVLEAVAALKAEGLEIAQCHLPYYPGHLPMPGDGSAQAFEDFILAAWIRSIELCGEIGCPMAVLHPFFDLKSEEATIAGNVYIIGKLMPYLTRHHVRLALENIYAHANQHYVNAYVSRPETILKILEQTDPEYVGACIDTGHANIFHINIGEMARMYGSRLFALHVNGNAGEDEHAMPYTMSGWCEKMDYYDFSAALREIGYTGFYNLEINPGKLPARAAQPYLDLAGVVARSLADLTE